MEFNATFLVSAISFIIFVLIMNKVLYEPITRIVEARQAYLRANDDAVSEHKKKAETVLSDKEAKLSDANREAKDTIFAEIETSKEVKNKALQDKKSEVADKIKVQKENITNEKAGLEGDISARTEDLSNAVVSKLLGGQGGSDA